eukprot:TRINITY_DN6023_c0_g1_i1.p1 TRINITY_DN6023_c0_g1~~TRINITY_DN6023_c0_g1_i1.p1  ORF type:complete len:341 (-),score=108.80 TRINITY_DN6023_c0_g1_i1:723-1712(-)
MSESGSSDGEVEFRPCIDIASLPGPVQNRLKALKNLQLSTVKAECEYYKEVHQLDVKYQKQYDEINKKRTLILSGEYEPSGAEIEWTDKKEEDEDEEDELTNGVGKIKLDINEDAKGIPKFWLHVLKNANEESLMGLIEPHDEQVLDYLTDITVTINQPANNGFTLFFHFSANPFFSNSVLSKEYTLREEPDPEAPLEFDGPEIIGCKGCSIDWKEGKNVTKTTVKIKKIKPRKGAKTSPDKAPTKEVKAESFFNFFSPPEVIDGKEDELSDEERATIAMDFDVGFAIKEKIIPRAVLYFTGEAFDTDDEYEDFDTEEEDDDSESDADN